VTKNVAQSARSDTLRRALSKLFLLFYGWLIQKYC